MARVAKKGRGAPGKKKSKAHRDKIAASLKAYHAGRKKKRTAKRSNAAKRKAISRRRTSATTRRSSVRTIRTR